MPHMGFTDPRRAQIAIQRCRLREPAHVNDISVLGPMLALLFAVGLDSDMTPIPRITLVTLGVTDVQRAWDFYKALGWQGSTPDNDVVFFQNGGSVFALWDRAKLAADSGITDDSGAPWAGITLATNLGSPEEVDHFLALAAAAGAEIIRPAAETFWGGYSGLFADFDGHRWEVAHNPFWLQDEAGNVTLPTL